MNPTLYIPPKTASPPLSPLVSKTSSCTPRSAQTPPHATKLKFANHRGPGNPSLESQLKEQMENRKDSAVFRRDCVELTPILHGRFNRLIYKDVNQRCQQESPFNASFHLVTELYICM